MVSNVDNVAAQVPGGTDAKPILSRAQLQAIEEDPSKMEVVARLMGSVHLEALFKYFVTAVDVNPMARIEFQKLLNRMGRLENATAEAGTGGPQVVINITRAKDNGHGVVIEGRSVDQTVSGGTPQDGGA